MTETVTSLRVLVVLGSLRDGRMADRVAAFVSQKLQDAGHDPVLLDPLALPNGSKIVKPLHFYSDPSAVPPWMTGTNELIKDCDSILVVTPEYNSTLPPALLALLGNFPPASYGHKPAGIVCYSSGYLGGVRAAAVARSFLSQLGLLSIPTELAIPKVSEVLDALGWCADERIVRTAEALVSELSWYSAALKSFKATVPPPDPRPAE